MTQEKGFVGVPGVPDGYELIAIRQARYMEQYIADTGEIYTWRHNKDSDAQHPIVRKTEKPKHWRAFVSETELFSQFTDDCWIIFQDSPSGQKSRLWGVGSEGIIFVAIQDGLAQVLSFTYQKAFEDLAIFKDGNIFSPFGIEVES